MMAINSGVVFFKFSLTFLFQLQIQGVAVIFMYAIICLIMIISPEVAPKAMLIAGVPAAKAAVNMMQLQIVFAASDIAIFTGLHDGRGDLCFFLGFLHGASSLCEKLIDAIITRQPSEPQAAPERRFASELPEASEVEIEQEKCCGDECEDVFHGFGLLYTKTRKVSFSMRSYCTL